MTDTLVKARIEKDHKLAEMPRQTMNLATMFYTERTMRKVSELIASDMDDKGGRDYKVLAALDEVEEHIPLSVEGSSLAKRISNWLYRDFQYRVPQEVMQRIGEIAAEGKGFTIDVDVTHRFDWNSGDFGDSGSCFFDGEYNDARCNTLPRLHASAMRFYRNNSGMGRCWVIPAPTRYVTGEHPMYVLTNYYGKNMTPQRAARVLCTLLKEKHGFDWSYSIVEASFGGVFFFKNAAAQVVVYPESTQEGNIPASISYESDDLDYGIDLPMWAAIGIDNYRDYDDDDDVDEGGYW